MIAGFNTSVPAVHACCFACIHREGIATASFVFAPAGLYHTGGEGDAAAIFVIVPIADGAAFAFTGLGDNGAAGDAHRRAFAACFQADTSPGYSRLIYREIGKERMTGKHMGQI